MDSVAVARLQGHYMQWAEHLRGRYGRETALEEALLWFQHRTHVSILVIPITQGVRLATPVRRRLRKSEEWLSGEGFRCHVPGEVDALREAQDPGAKSSCQWSDAWSLPVGGKYLAIYQGSFDAADAIEAQHLLAATQCVQARQVTW
jgi:hypothetical protein